MIRNILVVMIFIFGFITSPAQLNLGLSANFGNRLHYSSSYGMKSPVMPSGNLLISFNQELQHRWVIVYSAGLGVLGYSMNVQLSEPDQTDPFPFPEYNVAYSNAGVLFGKQLAIGNRNLLIEAGGGVTYFYSLFPTTGYTVSEADANGSLVEKFQGEITSFNEVIGFGKVGAFFSLNKLFTIGLQYSYHFVPLLNGTYQFENGNNTSSGTLSLHPNELSLVGTIRVSRTKK